MSNSSSKLVLRTSSIFYWLIGGILGGAFVLGLLVAVTKASDVWPPTAIVGFLLVAAIAVLLSTRLAEEEDGIHYRSLFIKIDVPVGQIAAAKFVTGFSGNGPYQRIVIVVRDKFGEREITINAGLFDCAKVKQLVDNLNARAT